MPVLPEYLLLPPDSLPLQPEFLKVHPALTAVFSPVLLLLLNPSRYLPAPFVPASLPAALAPFAPASFPAALGAGRG